MAQFVKKDKYQVVSQEERNVIFKVWKHLDKQIATGNSFKCLQAFDVNVTVEDTIMKEINCLIQKIKEFSILNKI